MADANKAALKERCLGCIHIFEGCAREIAKVGYGASGSEKGHQYAKDVIGFPYEK